jgi:2,2-dialkylglycine decarboxylase (pyruvate)
MDETARYSAVRERNRANGGRRSRAMSDNPPVHVRADRCARHIEAATATDTPMARHEDQAGRAAVADAGREPSANLATWQRDAASLLLVQPFMDSIIVGGDGCFLIDAEGRRILDLAAGQFCSILGHNHPEFGARLAEQAARLVHLGDQYVSPEVLAATSRLAAVSPLHDGKVVLLSTGSEANECAMRMAKTVTGRTGMLGFTRGYYGISLATHNLGSIGDHPGRTDFQPAPGGQLKLLTPSGNHCPVGETHDACTLRCLHASLELAGSQLANVAAVVVEPVLSAGGMIFPPVEYMRALREAADRHGFLFVADEAQTGFGRCGTWFDIEHYGVEPDMMVVSKTAGNGYPAAAVVASRRVAAALEQSRFMHLSSHQNDPLAAAALLAVIDIVERDKLVEHSRAMGEHFLSALHALKRRRRCIADVRGRGLMIGVELAPVDAGGADIAFAAAMLCERRGLHLTFSYFEPVLRIIPPLTITRAEIDLAVSILDDSLAALEAGGVDLLDVIPRNNRSGPFVKGMVRASPVDLARRMWNTSPSQWLRKLRSMRGR